MRNIGLGKIKRANIYNFTTKTGLKLRRVINKPLRAIFKLATKRKIIIESYPILEKGTPYIFASTHSFDEDIIAGLAAIDRSAYVLIGTTDQVDHNPQMYAAWLNGMIYVDRNNKKNRKDSVEKMKWVLDHGSSILIFPEGGWNNTENMLVQPLFAGPYTLSQLTGAKVVPISSFSEIGSDKIYINVGEPLDFANKTRKEALIQLRDSLGTMVYSSIEKHSTPIKRKELGEDYHIEYMEARRSEYMRVKWTKDVWDEELAFYKDKSIVTPQEVRASLEKVEITKENIFILNPILEKLKEDKIYDFKSYMKVNWNK